MGLGAMYIISFIVYGMSHSRNNSNFDLSDRIINEDLKFQDSINCILDDLKKIERELILNENILFDKYIEDINNLKEIVAKADTSGIHLEYSNIGRLESLSINEDSISKIDYKKELLLCILDFNNVLERLDDEASVRILYKATEIHNGSILVLNIEKYIVIAALTLMTIILLFLPMIIINPVDYLTGRAMEVYKKSFKKEFEVSKKDETEIIEQIVNEFGDEIKRLKD